MAREVVGKLALVGLLACAARVAGFAVYSEATKDEVTNSETKTHLLVFVDSTDNKAMRNAMLALAEVDNAFGDGKTLHVLMPCNGGAGDEVLRYFELGGGLPQVLVVEVDRGMTTYHGGSDVSEQGLVRFLGLFRQGKAQPTIRSQPVPPSQDGAVVEVVGDTFHDVVMASPESVLLFLYAPWCAHCKKYAPQFDKVAESAASADLTFAKIDATQNTIAHPDIRWSSYPSVFLLPRGDKGHPKRAPAAHGNEMRRWLRQHAHVDIEASEGSEGDDWDESEGWNEEVPGGGSDAYKPRFALVYEEGNSEQIHNHDIKTHFLLFVDTSTPEGWRMMHDFDSVARDFDDGSILHVIMPVPGQGDRVAPFFQLSAHDLPMGLIVETHKAFKNFRFNGAVTANNLRNFENDFRTGHVRPTLKSQLPKTQTDPLVMDMVGSEFPSHVMGSDKDVVMFFYAPWCAACNEFHPEFARLAANFAAARSVTFAKLDATENQVDHDKVVIGGYPTMYLFPANSKDAPIRMVVRSVEDMAEWLHDNVAIPITRSPQSTGVVEMFGSDEDDEGEGEGQFWQRYPSVVELDNDSFGQFQSSNPETVVMFYASWDSVSKSIRGSFALAAMAAHIPFAAVECSDNWDTCEEHGVVAYPTLMVVREGADDDSAEYTGDRSPESILQFVARELGSSAVSSLQDVRGAVARSVVVAYCERTRRRLVPGSGWFHRTSLGGSGPTDISAAVHAALPAAEQRRYRAVERASDLGADLPRYDLVAAARARRGLGAGTDQPVAAAAAGEGAAGGRASSQGLSGWDRFHAEVLVVSDVDGVKELQADAGRVLLFFFATWCPTSSRLRDDIVAAQADVGEFGVTVAGVNCEESWGVCEEAGVVAYPTLRLLERSQRLSDARELSATNKVGIVRAVQGARHTEL